MQYRANGHGLVLQERLEKVGLSRDELCALTNISPTTIARLIRGYQFPSDSTLDKIARAIGLNAADVVRMHKLREIFLASLKEKAKGKKCE